MIHHSLTLQSQALQLQVAKVSLSNACNRKPDSRCGCLIQPSMQQVVAKQKPAVWYQLETLIGCPSKTIPRFFMFAKYSFSLVANIS